MLGGMEPNRQWYGTKQTVVWNQTDSGMEPNR